MAISPNLSAVIIDNHPNTSFNLKRQLRAFGDIDLLETTQQFTRGLKAVYKYKPDVFFINGESLENNGNFFLSELNEQTPFTHIVFTCSCKEKASQIFGNIAPIFLINPFDQNKLQQVIERIRNDIRIHNLQSRLDDLSQDKQDQKVMLNTKTGYVFVDSKEIVFCQADSNYTAITLVEGKCILVTKSLCHFYEETLPFLPFIRISRSVVINKQYLTEIIKSERKCLLTAGKQTYSFTASPEYYRQLKKNNFSRYDLLNNSMPTHSRMLSLLNKNN